MAVDDRSTTSNWEACDLDRADSRLRLVREIVAMANSGGGRIVVGVDTDGGEVGIPAESADDYHSLFITDLVSLFTAPDRFEVGVHTRPAAEEHTVVTMEVPAAPEPPLVLGTAGYYENDGGETTSVFSAHSVVVRRNGRVDSAQSSDFRRWRGELLSRARDEMLDRLSMVIDAPAGATVRVIAGDEVRDEPNFFLSRSSDVFRRQPDRLLSSDDLSHLWLNRTSIDLDPTARELIIQSALRRRATLYLWLAFLEPESEEIRRYLFRTLDMKDRDKSDAARSILHVAALLLEVSDYVSLVSALSSSSYAHMREAAEQMSTMEAAKEQLASISAAADSGQLRFDSMDSQLTDAADQLLRDSPRLASRRAPGIGLELLRRNLERTTPVGGLSTAADE